MKKFLMSSLIVGSMALGATASLADDKAAEADSGMTCIEVSRLHHSKIVDNQTIILHMRGGPDYKMKLANRCSGLKLQGTWFHDAKGLAKLCSVDVIHVPVNTSGNVLDAMTRPCIIESLTVYDKEAEEAAAAAADAS